MTNKKKEQKWVYEIPDRCDARQELVDERKFSVDIVNQRLNFFLIFYSIIIAGAVSTESQLLFTLIFGVGALICSALFLGIFRAYIKEHILFETLKIHFNNHPAILADTLCKGNLRYGISARRFVGWIIPVFCVITLVAGFILAWIDVLSVENGTSAVEISIH